MTRRHRLDDAGVAKLKAKGKRYTHADPELPGHYVRVSTRGEKSFVVVSRDKTGKQIWRTVGAPPMPIDDARDKARKFIRGLREASVDSFEGVAEQWFQRNVIKNKHRSADQTRRILNQKIIPVLGDRDFNSIKRSDIARLLDGIEDNSGPRAADMTLTVIRQIMNWQAARDDNYNSPLVRGMSRDARTARSRILTDDEIRAIWAAASEYGSFGRLVQFGLLTAQRKEKLATMRWEQLEGNVWMIPIEAREKGNGAELVLPPPALEVLGPRGQGFVFPTLEGNAHSSWNVKKRTLDRRSGVTGWTIHDLRRTARSLMSRAGVLPHIAEMVMGHVQGGVEGIYDRHRYVQEKGDALAKLSGLLALILNPPADNIVSLGKRTA